MAQLTQRKMKSFQANLSKKKHQVAALLTGIAAISVTNYADQFLIKTPMYDLVHIGHIHMLEILGGHPVWFHNMMGISKHVFRKLLQELGEVSGLQDTKYVTCVEQLGIFLCMCRTGAPQCELQEHFQWSPDTISKYHFISVSLV